jgi:hypothetical protein
LYCLTAFLIFILILHHLLPLQKFFWKEFRRFRI